MLCPLDLKVSVTVCEVSPHLLSHSEILKSFLCIYGSNHLNVFTSLQSADMTEVS